MNNYIEFIEKSTPWFINNLGYPILVIILAAILGGWVRNKITNYDIDKLLMPPSVANKDSETQFIPGRAIGWAVFLSIIAYFSARYNYGIEPSWSDKIIVAIAKFWLYTFFVSILLFVGSWVARSIANLPELGAVKEKLKSIQSSDKKQRIASVDAICLTIGNIVYAATLLGCVLVILELVSVNLMPELLFNLFMAILRFAMVGLILLVGYLTYKWIVSQQRNDENTIWANLPSLIIVATFIAAMASLLTDGFVIAALLFIGTIFLIFVPKFRKFVANFMFGIYLFALSPKQIILDEIEYTVLDISWLQTLLKNQQEEVHIDNYEIVKNMG